MKFSVNLVLTIFIYVVLVGYSSCLSSKVEALLTTSEKSTLDMEAEMIIKNTKVNLESQLDDVIYKDYFWVQYMDPGKDPIEYLKTTERFSEWVFIIINHEAISFTPSEIKSNVVTSIIIYKEKISYTYTISMMLTLMMRKTENVVKEW